LPESGFTVRHFQPDPNVFVFDTPYKEEIEPGLVDRR
jgi:hypothetical protein